MEIEPHLASPLLERDLQMSIDRHPLVEPGSSDLTMDTIPQSLATPRDSYAPPAPEAGRLGEARNKLAAALWAFSLAQAAVPGLEAALAAGAPLPRDDLFELDSGRSALAEGAQALDL